MTNMQLSTAFTEASNYSDPDAFVSDMILSSAFSPDEDAAPDMSLAEPMRRIWMVARAPFRVLLGELGLSLSALSRRFSIPYRTVQDWAGGKSSCAVYIRRMIAEAMGYISPPNA